MTPPCFPPQPYGVKPNTHSILDVADIVYIDPINTGFSRILDKTVDRKVNPAFAPAPRRTHAPCRGPPSTFGRQGRTRQRVAQPPAG